MMRELASSAALAACLVLAGCRDAPLAPEQEAAGLTFAFTAPYYVARIALHITGPGIDSPIDTSFAVRDTVSATLRVPAGSRRVVSADAFDSADVRTHHGDTTVTITAGANQPVFLVLRALDGQLPVVVTFGGTGGVAFWALTGFPSLASGAAVSQLAATGAVVFAAVMGGQVGSSGPGVFRSIDGGVTWTRHDLGLTNTNTKGVAVGANGYVYAGTHGGGVFVSADSGITWTFSGLNGVYPQRMFASGNSIYAIDGFWCNGVYRTRDNGATWTHLLAGCTNSVAVDASGTIFVATGTGGLLRSTDDGSSWSGLGGTPTSLGNVVVVPSGAIYVGTSAAGVYESSDGGATWAPANTGLPGTALRHLAADGQGNLWVGLAGYPGAYRSDDGGASWANVSTGWDTASANGIGAFTYQVGGRLFASDGSLIWRSR